MSATGTATHLREVDVPYRERHRMCLRVPVGNGTYTAMSAMTMPKERFLLAVKDALKAKFNDQRRIDDYVESLFYGEYKVSRGLDTEDRWYIVDLVTSNKSVKERLLAPALSDAQLREEEDEKKRVRSVLCRYPRLTIPQLMYVADCEYLYAQMAVETAQQRNGTRP